MLIKLITSLCIQVLYHQELDQMIYNQTEDNQDRSKNPKHKGTLCFGKNLKNNENLNEIDLSFIINAFNDSDKKNSFFNNYFIKLVGTENLKNQIINNISQNDIKRSWETKLNKFKLVREKYLIYKN